MGANRREPHFFFYIFLFTFFFFQKQFHKMVKCTHKGCGKEFNEAENVDNGKKRVFFL